MPASAGEARAGLSLAGGRPGLPGAPYLVRCRPVRPSPGACLMARSALDRCPGKYNGSRIRDGGRLHACENRASLIRCRTSALGCRRDQVRRPRAALEAHRRHLTVQHRRRPLDRVSPFHSTSQPVLAGASLLGRPGSRADGAFTASPRRCLRTVLREMSSSRAIARTDMRQCAMIDSSVSIGPRPCLDGPSGTAYAASGTWTPTCATSTTPLRKSPSLASAMVTPTIETITWKNRPPLDG